MATRIGSWTRYTSSADPFTQAITVPSGAELMVVLSGYYDTGAAAPTAVTQNAVTMSEWSRVTSDVGEQTAAWTLVNPTTGDFVFNHPGAIDEGAHFWVSFWEDVDIAGTPVTALTPDVDGANNATVTTGTGTANTGDVAVGIVCSFGTDALDITGEVDFGAAFNSNQTAIGEIAGSGGSVSFSSVGDFPGISGIIIRNAVGGGGATPRRNSLLRLGVGR